MTFVYLGSARSTNRTKSTDWDSVCTVNRSRNRTSNRCNWNIGKLGNQCLCKLSPFTRLKGFISHQTSCACACAIFLPSTSARWADSSRLCLSALEYIVRWVSINHKIVEWTPEERQMTGHPIEPVPRQFLVMPKSVMFIWAQLQQRSQDQIDSVARDILLLASVRYLYNTMLNRMRKSCEQIWTRCKGR